MKRIQLLFAIALFSITTINAQEDETYGFSKGDTYITGLVNFNTFKQGDVKTTNFNFQPSVGYFVSDNIALSGGLIIGSSNTDAPAPTFTSDNTRFGGSIGASYFFTPSNRFSFLLSLQGTYEHVKAEVSNLPDDIKINTFGVAFTPGVNYFLSENFALTATVGALSYVTSKQDTAGAERLSQFGLNLDLSNIGFGATYKF